MSNRKHIYIFVPPGTDDKNPVVKYLQEMFPPLPTDDILEFYHTRIANYPNFCNNLEDIFEDLADGRDYITLVSMNDDDVFATLIFSINVLIKDKQFDEPVDISIELFCGNQSLPSTGEGTKLLKALEKASLHTSNHKIELTSVSESTKYYLLHGYSRKIEHPNKKKSPQGSLVSMRKNTRTSANWSKIRNSLSATDQRYLDKRYSIMKEEGRGNGKGRLSKKARNKSKNHRKTHKKSHRKK